MKFMLRSIALLAAVVLSAGAATAVQPVQVPPSTVTITVTQMGVPVDAAFTKFHASVDFDPVHPASASAQFTIDVASFDLGDAEYNQEVLKPAWLDAARFPTATFTSTSMKSLAPTQIEATGKITIKGITRDVRFPVTVKDGGKTRAYDGALRIHRTDFKVGTGEWQATDVVADEVVIKVHAVTATGK
jgi:polyisoprenoid-binding protein YceI